MTEPKALQKRRRSLLEQIGKAADEISKIDERLTFILNGKRPGAGAI